MPIQITTTKPAIGIDITRGQINIQRNRGEKVIDQTDPKVKIDMELPKITIDQYRCFAEIGLKNYLDLTKEYAKFGRQKILGSIAKIVSDGDRMAQIGNEIPPAIPEIAKEIAWKEAEYNIEAIPKSRPKIEVKGNLNIDWQLGKTNIEYKADKLMIDFKRGNLNIYLRQKGSIDIQYVDVKA